MKEKKLLQVVNLAPSESWIEKLVEIHPMKQIFWASIILKYLIELTKTLLIHIRLFKNIAQLI